VAASEGQRWNPGSALPKTPLSTLLSEPVLDTGSSQPQFDPNRALQGKTPGQPVPQAAQSAPPNTAPGQAANQTQPGLLPELRQERRECRNKPHV
jgi:hypothetical protein